jgi:methyl-accepting chemotaxis protein
MDTAEELIVALRAEGSEETQANIDQVNESVEETGEQMEDTSDELQGFRQQIQGVMGAVVAGAVASLGFLATQVPIVGEVFAGLQAIMSAFGFQVDRLLRKLGAGGLSGLLFKVADAVGSAEGPMATLAGVVGILGTALAGAAVAASAVLVKTLGWAGAASAIGGAIKGAAVAVGTLITGLTALGAALAILVAATVAFLAAYLTNWRGTRDKTDAIVNDILNFIVNGFLSLIAKALPVINDFTSRVVGFFSGLASDLAQWASDLADSAFEWGRNIIQALIGGIKSLVDRLRSTIDGIDTSIRSRLDVDLGSGGETTTGNIGTTSGVATSAGSSTAVYLDGRRTDEQTGRYRRDRTTRRGI